MLQEFEKNGWHWIVSEKVKENERLIHDILGKYLFFCPDLEPLLEIARIEIIEHSFPLAKAILPEWKIDEFVLCLYDYDNNINEKMLQRFSSYQETHGVRYDRWKSDEETRRGEYPPGFREKLLAKHREMKQKRTR